MPVKKKAVGRLIKGPRNRVPLGSGSTHKKLTETYKGGEVWSEEYDKAVGKDLQDCANPAEVHYLQSRTKSLGNFNSVKVEFGITLRCRPEDLEEVKELIMDKVEQEVNREVERLSAR